MLVVNDRVRIALGELEFRFVRSSGPGGQNVNKVNTKAVLRWNVASSASLHEDVRQRFIARHVRRLTREGELVITSQRYRDQARNVADCLEKLRQMLGAVATPPRARKKTRAPARVVRERLESKRRRAATKHRRRGRFDDDDSRE